jgi:hypothetical protein
VPRPRSKKRATKKRARLHTPAIDLAVAQDLLNAADAGPDISSQVEQQLTFILMRSQGPLAQLNEDRCLRPTPEVLRAWDEALDQLRVKISKELRTRQQKGEPLWTPLPPTFAIDSPN